MSKERRLGRGLEALLGQLPARNETAAAAQQVDQTAPPAKEQTPPQAGSATPSAEALFWLDAPHATTGQVFTQPHRPPAQTPASAAPANAALAAPGGAALSAAHGGQDARARGASASAKSRATPPSHGKTSTPRNCGLWPRAFPPTDCCSRWWSAGCTIATSLWPASGALRAAIQAGWVDVPVNVVEADDRQMAELAIVENLQRKDLGALEKAASFQKYLDQYGCTQEELAGRLKLDRSTIANLIRLLELPEGVQEALRRGKITPGHARALLPLGDEREQIEFCRRIEREGMNVRQTEATVQELIDSADREPLSSIETPPKEGRSPRAKSEHVAALEQQFRTALGLKVKITHNARGRGRLVVQFRNHEEFEQLKKQVCGT